MHTDSGGTLSLRGVLIVYVLYIITVLKIFIFGVICMKSHCSCCLCHYGDLLTHWFISAMDWLHVFLGYTDKECPLCIIGTSPDYMHVSATLGSKLCGLFAISSLLCLVLQTFLVSPVLENCSLISMLQLTLFFNYF